MKLEIPNIEWKIGYYYLDNIDHPVLIKMADYEHDIMRYYHTFYESEFQTTISGKSTTCFIKNNKYFKTFNEAKYYIKENQCQN